MNGYINNIISRYVNPGLNITPRLPGLFEPQVSQPVSLPVEHTVSTTQIKDTTKDDLHLSTSHKDWNQAAKTQKTEKAFLYNDHEDQNWPAKKNATAQKHSVEPQEQSFVNRPLIEDPVIEQKTFSSTILPLKREEKQEVNSLRHETFDQADKDKTGIKESFSFTKPRLNEPVPIEERIQYNSNTLLAPPAYHSVLPNENRNISAFNYHEGTSVIKVSIGRIEVRAISSASHPVKTPVEKPPSTKMSLDDYLKKRNSDQQ